MRRHAGAGRGALVLMWALRIATAAVVMFVLIGAAACGGSGDEATTTAPTSSDTTAGSTTTSAPSITTETSTTVAPSTTAKPAKLSKLTLVAPPGPMAIPMAYMAVNDALADVAEETELVLWQNADQLRAMVAGK